MKVHITSTPGYPRESIKAMARLLSSVKGEIIFNDEEPFTEAQLLLCSPLFHDLSKNSRLSFDALFNLAKTYRVIKSIPSDDFVVLISEYQNSQYWFSATTNRNIFVDTNGWEYLTEKDSMYGIASQIVENIFQSLIGIDYRSAENDPNIHLKSIGCINDLCGSKPEIMLKLRTGYICNSCLVRAKASNVSQLIISQIHRLMQQIRDRLMNFDFLQEIIQPEPTIVDSACNVKIGDTEIDLEDVQKTLFIFYLAHLEGLRVDALSKQIQYKEKLLAIYHKLRRGGKKETIDLLCLPYTDTSSTFQKVKSTTNRNLIGLLGNELSEFYVISSIRGGKHNFYKIKLLPDYLQFDLDL